MYALLLFGAVLLHATTVSSFRGGTKENIEVKLPSSVGWIMKKKFLNEEWKNDCSLTKVMIMSCPVSGNFPTFFSSEVNTARSIQIPLSRVTTESLDSIKKFLAPFSVEERKNWANGTDERGRTALALAVEAHTPTVARLDVVKYLINECAADPNLGDNENWTPLYRAATKERSEILSFLLANNANANAKNKDGSAPLHRAVDRGLEKEVEMLLSHGAEVNVVNCFGSPLAYAAKNGNIPIASFLLNHGADPNLVNDPVEFTPVELAANSQKFDMVDLLLRHNGKREVPTDAAIHTKLSKIVYEGEKEAIVNSFQRNECDVFGRTAAHYCAYLGKSDLLQEMKDINSLDQPDAKGRTPLHYAIMRDHETAFDFLIDSATKCSLLSKDAQGYSPIFWACQFNRPSMVRSLVKEAENRDELSSILSIQDKFSWMPIHKAAQVGNVEIVRMLVEKYKVDWTQTTANNRTPLDIAKGTQAAEVIKYLESLTPPLPLGAKKV